ncbi:alpha-amylase [Lewinellaceae bacterium SD302]|nr:alpha-amylase [Lewinellaceae bacterium SD302]
MRIRSACYFTFLCLFTTTIVAQHEDGPFQLLPEGVELSEYKIRQPTGLETIDHQRVEPPNWWTDMADPRLEILVYDRNVANATNAIVNHPGISVEYVQREANPNYLFIGLHVAPGTKAGKFTIELKDLMGKEIKTIEYELSEHPFNRPATSTATLPAKKEKKRRRGEPTVTTTKPYQREKLSQKDLIYLIMPDRFANGDPSNDSVEGMRQSGVNREKFQFRHGGDLLGIIEHLDYLEELGVTAIWLNPVLENDQPYASYHGYAVSDHYNIDARFGNNQQYKQFVDLAHQRGMKVIMDVIFNHVGDEHYQIKDIPSSDWVHQWPEYTQTTYRATTLMDPNVSEHDRELMTDGWFDKHMPDLNQQNPHLAKYLIQNSIWWTAFSGQDAFRIDTYAYPDPDFMAEWNRRLLEEFPNLGIYGETWVHGPGVQAYFTGSPTLHPEFNTNLPGVTDFQIYYAINEALGKDPGWTDGVMRLYYTLAQDYLYEDPTRNVLFLDNHDLARFYTVVDQDMNKFKSGMALLMTLRGIPMLYYGTEVGLQGAGGGFGEGGRIDFPGGWAGDEDNYFNVAGLTGNTKAIYDFTKRLANFRKNSKALTAGKLTQFVPKDGVYVYFRQAGTEKVMVVFNGNNEEKTFSLSPYQEILNGYQKGYEVLKDRNLNLGEEMSLEGKGALVIRLE